MAGSSRLALTGSAVAGHIGTDKAPRPPPAESATIAEPDGSATDGTQSQLEAESLISELNPEPVAIALSGLRFRSV